MNMRIAIDTGGTFTDCVFLRDGRLQVLKLFSTPANPADAILEGLRQIAPGEQPVVRHGTTVGTNALLERKGARVAFVTTDGFEDTIAIGRQARPKLYDWFLEMPPCIVPAALRFGVPERTTDEGEILKAPTDEEHAALIEAIRNSGAESVALSLLFSFANPANECAVEAVLGKLGIPISTSHRILPEFREYERASTVVVNAYLAPRMQRYLLDLESQVSTRYSGSQVQVMQSSGGIIAAKLAAPEPVRTVLSGPAGGVIGAHQLAALAGYDRIIGFDMGGTSTDVCLIDGIAGGPRISNEAVVAGLPVAVPMLDIHTVGAGGGSLARFDAGGMLRVGPESAGSDPGPICFGRGSNPTVTDANLILGRLDSERFLGGAVRLDVDSTRSVFDKRRGSLATVEAFAEGILRLVEVSMEKAIRVISIERGHDPRDFTLVAFGGGGPLHACALARSLRVPRVLVPCLPGALSAVGILFADAVRDYSRTVMLASDSEGLDAHFTELEHRGHSQFAAEGLTGVALRTVDLRYRGQGYELNIPYSSDALAGFHALHKKLYGFADEDRAVEIVNVRVRMISASTPYDPPELPSAHGTGRQAVIATRSVIFAGKPHATPIYERSMLEPGDTFAGPAIVAEYSSTTVLPPGDVLRVDARENLIIEIGVGMETAAEQ